MITEPEEKFENVHSKITDRISEQSMFNKFLELYPEEWKQLKITFSKFKRSKQFGRTIPLPRPEQALRKDIRVWLKKKNSNK